MKPRLCKVCDHIIECHSHLGTHEYVSRNDMLIETMRSARPETPTLLRLAPPYPASITTSADAGTEKP